VLLVSALVAELEEENSFYYFSYLPCLFLFCERGLLAGCPHLEFLPTVSFKSHGVTLYCNNIYTGTRYVLLCPTVGPTTYSQWTCTI